MVAPKKAEDGPKGAAADRAQARKRATAAKKATKAGKDAGAKTSARPAKATASETADQPADPAAEQRAAKAEERAAKAEEKAAKAKARQAREETKAARAVKEAAEAEQERDANRRRRARVDKARDAVAGVAYAFENRDRIVADTLALLERAGLLDVRARARVWSFYEAGDTRTRLAIQETIARVLRVPLGKLEALEDADEFMDQGKVDLSKVSRADLARLVALEIPTFDPAELGARIRQLDIDRFLRDDAEMGAFSQFLVDLPVKFLRMRRALMATGLVLLILVAAALVFPQQAQLILFYGLLVLLALFAGYLLRVAYRIDRAFRRHEIDLTVITKLSPHERRILLLRRIWLHFVDTNRLADQVERILHAAVPSAFIDQDEVPGGRAGADSDQPPPETRGSPPGPGVGGAPAGAQSSARTGASPKRVAKRIHRRPSG